MNTYLNKVMLITVALYLLIPLSSADGITFGNTNLLLNSGLESGTTVPDNWALVNTGTVGTLIYPVSPGLHDSTTTACLNYNSAESGKEIYLTQTVDDINPLYDYQLSGFMNTSGISNSGSATIEVDWFNGTKWLAAQSARSQTGTTDGRFYLTSLIPGAQIPANATKAKIDLILHGGSAGSTCFDDIAFYNDLPTLRSSLRPWYGEIQGYFSTYNPVDSYKNINYSALSTVIYHHINVNGDGSLNTNLPYQYYDPGNFTNYTHNQVDNNGHSAKAVLSFMQASAYDTDLLLSNTTAQTVAINNLLNEVHTYGFDGIDNDLENTNVTNSINGQSNRDLLSTFQENLYNSFKASTPDNGSVVNSYRVSIALDHNLIRTGGTYDTINLSAIQNYVDFIMPMGYGWAAPWLNLVNTTSNMPLNTIATQENGIHSMMRMYKANINKNKLLLGMPWYGYEHSTIDDSYRSGLTDSKNMTSIKYKDYIDFINSNIGTYTFDNLWQTPYYAFQTGLLENPGFEWNGTYGWSYTQTGTMATFNYTSPGRTDNHSVSISYSGNDTGNEAYYYQKVKIDPTKAYNFSAWVKTDNISLPGDFVKFELGFYNSSMVYISSLTLNTSITGTQDWTQYNKSVLSTDIPSNAAFANLDLIFKQGNGTAYFDDIMFNDTDDTQYWKQLQVEDIDSLNTMFGEVKGEGWGGIGIWELGQGNNRSELWNDYINYWHPIR